MITVDAKKRDRTNEPDYLRRLIERANLTQKGAAILIGVDQRTMRRYLALDGDSERKRAPYAAQVALECLAAQARERG